MRVTKWLGEGSRLRQATVRLVGGAGLGEIVAFLGAVPLAVIFTPGELGVYGAIGAAAGIAAMVGGAALDLAIPSVESRSDAARLGSASLILSGVLSLTLTACSFGLAGTVLPMRLALIVAAVAVASWSLTAFRVTSAMSVRDGSYRRLSIAQVVRSSVQVAIQVLLGVFTDAGTAGLVVGLVAGRLVASIMMLPGCGMLVWLSPSGVASVVREHREYPGLAMPAELMTLAGVQLPMIVTPWLFGADAAGNLYLARRVLAGPTGVIARAVGLLYFGEAANATREGRTGRKLFAAVVRSGSALAVALVVGSAALGPWVVPAALGAEWFQAGVLLAVLAPVYGGQLVASPLSRAFQVYSAQGALLLWAAGRLGLVVALFLGAWLLSLGFLLTMSALAVVLTGAHVVQVLQAKMALERHGRLAAS